MAEVNEEIRRECETVVDSEGLRVLHYAAGTGLYHLCRFMIETVGVTIDVKNNRGETPLVHAMRLGHVITAEYLINNDADVAISDYMGYTSLHYAVQNDNMELMELLLMKGADIEADCVGGTPLYLAVSRGNVEYARFLLDHVAERNSVSKVSGNTPLVGAILSQSVECMELLLEAGADPNKVVNELSPLVYVAKQSDRRYCDALLAAGEDVVAISARQVNRKVLFKYLREEGNDAGGKKDYDAAVAWYTEGLYYNPSNEKLLSNRSLCWELMGKGVFALRDAEECVRLKQDWIKSHFRLGNAWKLLERFRMSSDAYTKALTMDPGNIKILKAVRENTRLEALH